LHSDFKSEPAGQNDRHNIQRIHTFNLTVMNKKTESEELIILKRELAFQKVEIETLTAELILIKKEHTIQNAEKQKRADELIIANKELAFQKDEKQKRADELIIANKELAFQNDEKQKRADELIIANKELAFQKDEKQKRADELIIANKELAFQNDEKQKRADELIIANKELVLQYEEKRELAAELTIAYGELKKIEVYLRSYIKGLQEMMFITSHKVRQPVAHILGISNLLNPSINYSLDELKKIVGYIKKSALALDNFTRELSAFMNNIHEENKKLGITNFDSNYKAQI
jgi:signal transduction histidine kinase